MLLILKPDASGFSRPWLLPAGGLLLMYALYLIATRLVSCTDASATSFSISASSMLATATLIGPFFWSHSEGWDKADGLLGITGMTGHYLVICAYALLDASAAQPVTYLGLVHASLFGVLLFMARR